MILTIYNGKSDIVVLWHIELNSTAEKTHPRVTTDQQSKGCLKFRLKHRFPLSIDKIT